MRTPVTVAVVGAAAAAHELARALAALPQASVRWVCDESSAVPQVQLLRAEPTWTHDLGQVLADEELDAVAFTSTDSAGRGLVRRALEAGKHVLIEGPLAISSLAADQLVDTAVRNDRRLWVHTPCLGRPAVRTLHSLVERGVLGEIYYLHGLRYSAREHAGADLIWGLGAESVALVLELLGDQPIQVTARADSYLGGRPDVVFAQFGFATGIRAHLHLSRLEGVSVERLSVVGSDLTAVLDRTEAGRELSIRVSGTSTQRFDDLVLEQGSSVRLHLPPDNSLQEACIRFLTSVRSPGDMAHGRGAAAVVAVVEALEGSWNQEGESERVPVRPTPAELDNVIEFRQ